MVKRTSGTQLGLTAVFLTVMLLGFSAVAVITEQYSAELIPITIYTSDSDVQFGTVSYADTLAFSDTWFVKNSQQLDSNENDHTQINKTAIFTGNNTWAISVLESGVGDTGITTNKAIAVIELPEAKSQLYSSINITSTSNNEDNMQITAAIVHFNNDIWPQGLNIYSASLEPYSYAQAKDISLETLKDLDFEISTVDSIETYAKAQEHDSTYLLLSIGENGISNNGLSEFSWEISFTLEGSVISSWGLEESINTVKFISGSANFIVGIFMLDAFDVGGYMKDLPKRRKKGR